MKTLIFAFLSILLLSNCGKGGITPSEGPEEVVRKFYAYIKEGGTTTLGEAYRLIDTANGSVAEDAFKKTASQYPKDMEVKILGSRIEENKEKAVVTIEYKTASAFGGFMVSQTEINLLRDREKNLWKIDYSGDSYDENPSMYASQSPKHGSHGD